MLLLRFFAIGAAALRPAAAPSFESESAAGRGTKAQHFLAALSADECAAARSLVGHASNGVIKTGGTYERHEAPPPQLRSTRLRWLPHSADSAWLYDRILAIARQANTDASWHYPSLEKLQNLQLGVYDAREAGHYTWHCGTCGSSPGLGPFSCSLNAAAQTRSGRNTRRRWCASSPSPCSSPTHRSTRAASSRSGCRT